MDYDSSDGGAKMGPMLAVAGLALLALALGDAITTTLRAGRRGGPVTRLVAGLLWRGLRSLRRWGSRLPPSNLAGVIVTLSVVAFWIAMMIVGWFLLFSSSPRAVLDAVTGQPAGSLARFYFAGYAVFTLVFGDLRPSGTLWQTCTLLAAGSGLFLTTIAITYLIPLTTSASQKRQLARVISGLGRNPADVVIKGWSGKDFRALEGWLSSLTPMLTRLAEHHLAYPMLHFFHTADRDPALAPSIAVLDEALLLLGVIVDDEIRPSPLILDPPRAAIGALLATMPEAYLSTAEEPPPIPDLAFLDEHGIPHRPLDDTRSAFAGAAGRRRQLLSLVHHEGWTWDAVIPVSASLRRPWPGVT
ncbi:MAG: hypothetical protein ABR592_06645 [Nitriliruptorales bacterium]